MVAWVTISSHQVLKVLSHRRIINFDFKKEAIQPAIYNKVK